MTMDYSPCLKREIWPFLKGSNISETRDTTPTKTGVHALDIDPYLHELFEPILINFGKGNLAVFESSNISETEEAMPTKTGVHA